MAESPTRGGTLRFAMIDTPLARRARPDATSTTVSQHFLETLFAFTEKYEPSPFGQELGRDGGMLSS
jgi:hypothetical protein